MAGINFIDENEYLPKLKFNTDILICPQCGNSDKYVKYYHLKDMICLGCGYDLKQITPTNYF